MKKLNKISFLISAHNEEKIIGKTLNNLLSLPYNNYEVIIGLDGCTDNTEKIVKGFVKRSKKFRYKNLNLRRGKPAVIDEIIKQASGDIIIINDADWIFKVKNEKKLKNLLSVFENKEIGGIAESFPVEWDEEKIKRGNLGYKMVAYGTYFWFEFLKDKYGIKNNKLTYLNKPQMFLTNILRKKLYKKNFSLADDFERTKDVEDQGYKVVLFDDILMPRMTATYNKIYIKDLFKQKIRTAIARKQLKTIGKEQGGALDYYLPSALYILRKGWGENIKVGFYVTLWLSITNLGEIISRFKKADTKKGWTLRAKR